MKKAIIVTVIALMTAACSGGDDSPTAPTPQYPSMIGGWGGTFTVNATLGTLSGSNTCTQSWTITDQTGGQFSGTWQLSGGTTVSCGQSGVVNGTITSSGSFADLTFGVQVGAVTGCTRTSSAPYSGVVTGNSLSVQSSEQLTCTGSGGTFSGSRSLVTALTRR
jgi:hypothetical protein